MKTTVIWSLGLAIISAVLAAPAAQHEEEAPTVLYAGTKDKWALHVNSVSGNPPMFKNRSIVALGEGTIDGVPQNHAPQTQVHLPPTFGLENFTTHPLSTPVTFTLAHVGDHSGTRYSLTNVTLTSENWRNVDFATKLIFYKPNNFIAIGWYTLFGEQGCPNRLGCDPLGWEIREEGDQKLLKPADQAGAWDAVKTKEGHGWRVVWKVDAATVHNEVKISVVPFDK